MMLRLMLISLFVFSVFVGSVVLPEDDYDDSDEQQDHSAAGTTVVKHGTLNAENDRSENEVNLRILLIHNSKYDRRQHPGLNDMNVSVSISLHDIKELDEYQGIISMNAQMGFRWFDNRINWIPSNYSNLTVIPVGADDIYHPDILLLNSYDVSGLRPLGPAMALLHSDGKVLWYPTATLKVMCSVDAKYWPFTAMECDFKFGTALRYDDTVRLYLRKDSVWVEHFKILRSWKLLKSGQFILPADFNDLSRPYGKSLPWVRLFLERQPNNFLISLYIVPLAVLLLAGILFWLTNDSWVHYILGILELMFFCGVQMVFIFLIPASSTSRTPLLLMVVDHGTLLILFLLFFGFFADLLARKTTKLPEKALFLAEVMTKCTCICFQRKRVLTFSDPEDLKARDWIVFASAVKMFVTLLYFTAALCLITISLVPFVGTDNARWLPLKLDHFELHD